MLIVAEFEELRQVMQLLQLSEGVEVPRGTVLDRSVMKDAEDLFLYFAGLLDIDFYMDEEYDSFVDEYRDLFDSILNSRVWKLIVKKPKSIKIISIMGTVVIEQR